MTRKQFEKVEKTGDAFAKALVAAGAADLEDSVRDMINIMSEDVEDDDAEDS